MLGGASNVLIADEGIRGLVIKNLTKQYTIDTEHSIIEADSGVLTNVLVRAALDAGLKGLEQFMGVPGTVGGAVFNNSHFSTELIGAFVKQVHVIDAQGESNTLTKEQMQFAYDYSILHETHDVIISIEFLLEKGQSTELEKSAFDATRKRATTQPLGIPSSGCMFKNATMPDGKKVGAGYLIDQAGLKGKTIGGAKVSEVHANFIVNTGTATQKDIEALAQFVEKTIHEKYGVELKREAFRLGGA
jgi:UDP-N-acetylmuramate dehydrogenase